MLALVLAAAMVGAGGGALYFFATINPVHTDPATVPSQAADADVGRYSAAVDKAKHLARALVVDENLPGFSVAVAVDGEVVWAEGFGYADIDRRTPVTPRTRFRLGSVSKTLTAAGVALLHDRGRIDLDAPVQRYVPLYPRKEWTITIRQLMGDVAGVHRIRGDNNDQLPFGHCASLAESLETFAGEPLLFEPGTKYRFATNGWVLLSAAIEGATAEPFPVFMHREVFVPLGMTRTVLQQADDDADIVSAYFPRMAMRPKLGLQTAPVAEYSCFAGAGAFLSTPLDLVRLGSATLKPGLLKADTIAIVQEPLRLASGASTGFALGWKVDDLQLAGAQTRVLRHRGTPLGGTVSLTLVPSHKLAIAAAANVSYASGVDPFVLQIAEAFATAR